MARRPPERARRLTPAGHVGALLTGWWHRIWTLTVACDTLLHDMTIRDGSVTVPPRSSAWAGVSRRLGPGFNDAAGSGPGDFRRSRVHLRMLVGCLLVLVLPCVLFVWSRSNDPSDGTFTSTAQWSDAGLRVGTPTGPSALQSGDLVVAVDGVRLRGRGLKILSSDRLRVGSTAVYTVIRGGTARQLTVHLRRYRIGAVLRHEPGALVSLASLDAVALLVIAYRPRAPAARLLLVIGGLIPLTGWQWPAGLQVADVATGRVGPYIGAEVAAATMWAALGCFAFVFPSPLVILERRPWILLAVGSLPFLLYGVQVLLARFRGGAHRDRVVAALTVSTPGARVIPLLIVAVLIARYRLEPSPIERLPLRWLLIGFTGGLSWYVLLGVLPSALIGHWLLPPNWLTAAFAAVPLSIGAGVLRYRMLDIDVIFTRTLLYLTLTVTALALYAAATLGLERWVGHGFALVSASALIAVVVLSIRDRWLRRTTRLLYGDRDDPYRIVDRLSRIDVGQPPITVLTEIAGTVSAALRLPHVALEVALPLGQREGVTVGSAGSSESVTLDLDYRGERLGRMLLTTGAGREPFGPVDARLLEDLSWHVASAVHGIRVGLTLQRSRQQIVTAREEERRRIRRDLHDGLAPSIAAAAMQLEVAGELVDAAPAQAQAVIAQLESAAHAALVEIRRLVDDLRPPALDALGLLSAIRERVEHLAGHAFGDRGGPPLAITVSATGSLDGLTAAVEVAAYRIGVEAVTNAARHAGAAHCDVLVERTATQLLLTITDDGRGIPPGPSSGLGLVSMQERAEELGGSCSAGPGEPAGTVVRAALPLFASGPESDGFA